MAATRHHRIAAINQAAPLLRLQDLLHASKTPGCCELPGVLLACSRSWSLRSGAAWLIAAIL
jgi:hypothetical protein